MVGWQYYARKEVYLIIVVFLNIFLNTFSYKQIKIKYIIII